MNATEPSIVIGIPGNWKNRSEIVTSIAQHSGGYLFTGNILMHTETGSHLEIDIYEHDPSFKESVRSGGMGQISEEDIDALSNHTFTLYLLSDETGRDVVERMMDAVVGLLDAGGLLVKIESAGFSVSSDQWREHATVKAPYSLYRSMVALVGEGREHFTCGMGAFDIPDCAVIDRDLEGAFELATEFCCYMMDEKPKFAEGHTFSISEGVDRYVLSFEDYTYYPPDDMFHNPNDLWKLKPKNLGSP